MNLNTQKKLFLLCLFLIVCFAGYQYSYNLGVEEGEEYIARLNQVWPNFVKYKIIYARNIDLPSSIHDLSRKVNEHIEIGYKPHGGVSIAVINEWVVACQSVVKQQDTANKIATDQ